MYQELNKAIIEAQTIIIHRHSEPDGDAIGSQLGLKALLNCNFPNKNIYVVGDHSERFANYGAMDYILDEVYKNALVIILDSGDEKLISDERYKKGKRIIKIDHHLSQAEYGDINIIDSQEISTASLIGKIFRNLDYQFNDEVAKLLYLGIVADSNRFLYRGVNSAMFELVAFLTKYNFSIEEIYENLYSKSLSFVKLRAQLTLDFLLTKNNVAYLMTSKEKRESYQADFFTISRGMVNIMSGITEVAIWVNFTEDDNGFVIAEIRSNKYNINPYALKYGGGGHMLASGATLKNFDEAKALLNDLDQFMEENNNANRK